MKVAIALAVVTRRRCLQRRPPTASTSCQPAACAELIRGLKNKGQGVSDIQPHHAGGRRCATGSSSLTRAMVVFNGTPDERHWAATGLPLSLDASSSNSSAAGQFLLLFASDKGKVQCSLTSISCWSQRKGISSLRDRKSISGAFRVLAHGPLVVRRTLLFVAIGDRAGGRVTADRERSSRRTWCASPDTTASRWTTTGGSTKAT